MPRYFCDIRRNDEILDDNLGFEATDDAHAIAITQAIAAVMLKANISATDTMVRLRSQTGASILEMSISQATRKQ